MLSDREKELMLAVAETTVGRQDGYLEIYRRGIVWIGTSSSHPIRFEGDTLEAAFTEAAEQLGVLP